MFYDVCQKTMGLLQMKAFQDRLRLVPLIGLTVSLSVIASGYNHSAFSVESGSRTALTGSVQENIYMQDDLYHGVVSEAANGLPIDGARILVPDAGIQTVSARDGSFVLPPLPSDPMIVNVLKPGFAPESLTLSAHASQNAPLHVRLREEHRVIVIDDRLRHLGDNSFSPNSAGAGKFRHASEGVVLAFQFHLNGLQPSSQPVLQIGSIIGLDTRQAHLLNQNNIPYTSSPMVVRLNGTEIAYLQINGDHQRIEIPPGKLATNGLNTLEIEAGYHTPGGVRIDYDDFELMNLQLEL